MAEKVISEQPQATPSFFIKPTSEVKPDEIKNKVIAAFDNIKTDGTGLSGANGAPTEFETGLFDCFADVPTCLCAWCCSPCLFHRTYHVMNVKEGEPLPEEDFVGGTCLSFCLVSACTGIGGWFWSALRRGAIREKYNLNGSTRMDFLLTCCCGPCVIAQEDIEVRKIEKRRLLDYQNSQKSIASQQL